MRHSVSTTVSKNQKIRFTFYCSTKHSVYIHICMNFFCRKRNGENLRRKVHYVSFGYSMQCRTAFQFLHNRIDNNILCAVFRSKWQHVSFIYFYHHVVYTAIVFRAYSTPQSNSHNNQKKRN